MHTYIHMYKKTQIKIRKKTIYTNIHTYIQKTFIRTKYKHTTEQTSMETSKQTQINRIRKQTIICTNKQTNIQTYQHIRKQTNICTNKCTHIKTII